MPTTYDRRTFLTHSAATVGGVAMAGTVVDVLLEGVAGATTGINTGTPVLGGTLNVGLGSDDPPPNTFTGSTGKLDAAGFCIANAVYDSLFLTSSNGKNILPNLGLTIVGSNAYKTWKVTLRQNVKFHDGSTFNAAAVVANFNAAKANPTVGLAINPLLASCVATGTYSVTYTMVLPFYSFPFAMSESQIGYMANPTMFASHYSGNPNGTGPFKFSSWTPGTESSWVKNSSYWRKDHAGRALPYLNQVNFHTLPDPASRLTALTTNTVQIAVFSDGQSIHSIEGNSSLAYLNSLAQKSLISPAMNFVMCNVASKSSALGTPASTVGHFNTGTQSWVAGTPSPIGSILIREALAYAIDTHGYLSSIDSNIGAVSNGLFMTGNPYYANPGYPVYNTTTSRNTAKAKVAAWKSANGNRTPVITVHTLNTSLADAQFAFIQRNAAAVGITLNQFSVNLQSTYIDTYAIGGMYEMILWQQFGGTQQSFPLNYVWWDSSKTSTGAYAPGFPHFGAYPGLVNFAQNVDGKVESALISALGASTSTAQVSAWKTINSRFAIDIPYLWLDVTVVVWAAQKSVQNWAGPMAPTTTSVNSTQAVLSPDGGVLNWAQIWL